MEEQRAEQLYSNPLWKPDMTDDQLDQAAAEDYENNIKEDAE